MTDGHWLAGVGFTHTSLGSHSMQHNITTVKFMIILDTRVVQSSVFGVRQASSSSNFIIARKPHWEVSSFSQRLC